MNKKYKGMRKNALRMKVESYSGRIMSLHEYETTKE